MSDDLVIYRHTDEDGDQLKIESRPYLGEEGRTPTLLVHSCSQEDATSVRLLPSEIRELAGRLTIWLLEHDPSSARTATDIERVRGVLETESVVGRSALEYRGLISSALMTDEASDTESDSVTRTANPMDARCSRCGHTYATHTQGTSGPCQADMDECDCPHWNAPAPAPIPSPRSEWSDFARRREALRAAVSVWTTVDNVDPSLDSETVIAWAQDFEHYLSTGTTLTESVTEPTAHVPLPFTESEPDA